MLARVVFLIAVFAGAGVVLAQDIVFPELTGRVVDDAEVLSASQERTLTDWLERHEDDTTNQVVVVTVPSLQGLEIEDYGYQLGRHWGIGQAEHDNGVLLIVAPEERKVRIEVGYGLEGALTDGESRLIIDRHLLPAFRAGNYGEGIEEAVPAILAEIGDEEFTRESLDQSGSTLLSWVIMIVVIAIFASPFLIAIALLFMDSVVSDEYRSRPRNRHRNRENSIRTWEDDRTTNNGYTGHRPSRIGFSGGGFGSRGFRSGGGSFGGGGASGSW